MSHFLIIDGHALAHRAYHSIPQLTSQGQPVNAIYGFYSIILSALSQLNPTHLTVCLDSPGPTFRNKEYIAYRTQRQPTDSALLSQLPLLPQTLAQANISHFALGGYEADDLIATLAKHKKPTRITIITGDKDLLQLVTPRVKLFMPQSGLSQNKLFGPKQVKQKLGVKPSQIVDLKALMGDPSDNYPGVSGIGPKTAVDLLSQYSSLDNIYKNLDHISGRLHDRLKQDKDNAYLSQKLAQLVYDAPLKFKLSAARLTPSRLAPLLSLFTSYNFRSLASRLTRLYPSLAPAKSTPLNPSLQKSLF